MFLTVFSTRCSKWNTAAMKSLLLFMAGLFIEFLVEKCIAFGWHHFCFSPFLMRKRVQKSQVILALLDSFQELTLNCIFYCVFMYLISFLIFMHVCKIWDTDMTEYQVWYRLTELYKAFTYTVFSHRKYSRREMFGRISSYTFGCRKKALSDFLATSSSLQKVNTGKLA